MVKNLLRVEGFRGPIEQRVRPNQQKFILPFGVMVSPIRKYLLCSDEKSSGEIADRLKAINMTKTLVIL
jgi:hypothetical protein